MLVISAKMEKSRIQKPLLRKVNMSTLCLSRPSSARANSTILWNAYFHELISYMYFHSHTIVLFCFLCYRINVMQRNLCKRKHTKSDRDNFS